MIYRKHLNVTIYVLTCLVILLLCFFILFNANWLLGDQLQFLRTTAIGKVLPIENYIIPELGRFFPLGLMDYNLLLVFPFEISAYSHYVLNAISFLIFAFSFFFLLLRISTSFNYNKTIALLISFFLTLFVMQRVYLVFLDLIFPERLMSALLSLFILFNFYITKKAKPILIICSIFIAIYLTYSKEPTFGALFIFATICILANWKIGSNWFKSYQIILLINSLMFIGIYYFVIYRNVTILYDGSHGENDFLKNIFQMIWSHKIIIPALILLPIRFVSFFINQNYSSYFYDALLFSGISYFGACLFLNLNFTYYYLPSVVLITPSVLYYLFFYTKQRFTLTVAIIFGVFYAVKLPANIKSNQIQRKSTYPQIETLANSSAQGYDFYWIIPEINKDDWDLVLDEWRRESYESYISYILKDENFNIKKDTTVDLSKNSKAVFMFNKSEFEILKIMFFLPRNIKFQEISTTNEICIIKTVN